MRRILSIDGGGIKGVFPASFLAELEDALGCPIADFFDLIVGTSTGGIIAIGLGLGLSAHTILDFYRQHGPKIFPGNRFLRLVRQIGISKYRTQPLADALISVFGDRRLGHSKKRLVIPSCNLETGEVYIWKTSHHPRLERDYNARAVDVALATASAPTYFAPHRAPSGLPLVDGGVWANNPVAVAAVESIGILEWPRDELRILSLGCTTCPLDIGLGRVWPLGLGYWALKITDFFMTAQSMSAFGMAQHLVGNREMVVRISPTVGPRFQLDKVSEISSLMGLGESESRKALPSLRPIFFQEPVNEDFEPYHRL